MNGRNVHHLSEHEATHLLQEVKDTMAVVVLRYLDNEPMKDDLTTTEEMGSLKDSLSLAVLEMETVQQENRDLGEEMERYVFVTIVADTCFSEYMVHGS